MPIAMFTGYMHEVCTSPQEVLRTVFQDLHEIILGDSWVKVAISLSNALLLEVKEKINERMYGSIEGFGVPVFKRFKMSWSENPVIFCRHIIKLAQLTFGLRKKFSSSPEDPGSPAVYLISAS